MTAHSSNSLPAVPIRAILFDLDGTLVQTEKVAVDSLVKVLSDFGTHLPPELAWGCFGKKWNVAIDLIFKALGKDAPKATPDEVLRASLAEYRFRLKKQGPVAIPGAREFIESLPSDLKIAIVTGSYREDAFAVVDQWRIRSRFTEIVGSEDYPESKPSPQGYLLGLKKLGCTPEESLCFEDSPAGIASARAAGLRVVVVTETHRELGVAPDLTGAHLKIQNFTDMTLEKITALLARV